MKPKQISMLLTGVLFILLSAISCKKDNDNSSPAPVVYPNYSQLKTGNYWIYQRFNVDGSGNATPTSVYDSCYVEKDTLINSLTYYKMIRPSISISIQSVFFLRDTLHYTVENGGKIFFSSQDFTTFIEDYYVLNNPVDTVCRIVTKMAEKDWMVTTPAGTYQTSNMKKTYYMYPNWSAGGSIRPMDMRFAKDVGIVTETLPFYASNPTYVERRLVRFHLN